LSVKREINQAKSGQSCKSLLDIKTMTDKKDPLLIENPINPDRRYPKALRPYLGLWLVLIISVVVALINLLLKT